MTKLAGVFYFLVSVSTFIAAIAPSRAAELTDDQRARLFAPTQSVRFIGDKIAIPMKGTDHAGFYECPYFEVFVNGKGPFTFLYDTGASYTLVNSRVVEAARPATVVDRAGRRDVVELDHIRIGGVVLEKVWAIHDDNFGVDGILGFPAFRSSNLIIDLTARKLVVGRSPIALRRAFQLPYEAPFNVPTIPLKIGSRTVQTLIDTGDDAYGLEMRTVELQGSSFARPPVAAESVLNGANVQTTRVATLTEPVGLGSFVADGAVIGINDDLPVGDLGYDVLRQFRLAIEPERRLVWFQPLFAGRRFQIRGSRSLGFTPDFSGKGTVSKVVPGSLAELAELKSGDSLVSIGGWPAADFTPRSWDRMLQQNRAVRVRWLRDGRYGRRVCRYRRRAEPDPPAPGDDQRAH